MANATAAHAAKPSGPTILEWDPEDAQFWSAAGRRIAYRNLWISVYTLLFGFVIWMVWSAIVVSLPQVGFQLSTGQLFWLTALPGLTGATLRIFYSFAPAIFGGRNWTTLSTASLLVPAVGIGLAVRDPQTPFGVLAALALLCGLGGANFASSMANITFFFPKAQKGLALGLNAGLSNLGVSVVQFSTPLIIGASLFGSLGGGPQTLVKEGVSRSAWLQNAGLFWVPFILAGTAAAWWGMNNLATAKASFRDQAVIFRRQHTWWMCLLYSGTFGSFIGYSAGFPLLIKSQFPEVNALSYAFLGPLVGAAVRPLGGWLADKLGGARVTFWNFLVMIAAAFGVLHFLAHRSDPGAFGGFLAMFLVLFTCTGIGNGSVFRMVPVIFLTEAQRRAGSAVEAQAIAARDGAREAAAVVGFSSAIAAYGAFFVPQSYGLAIRATGSPQPALYGFILFYAVCVAATWACYSRKGARVPC